MSLPPLTFNAWLRYDLIVRFLERLDGVSSVLEIGAGEGSMGVRLARWYTYVGVEPDMESFRLARARLAGASGEVRLGDVSVVDPGATFDLVCAFEVLEHIEDDAGALQAWQDRLRPHGWLLLSVPAYQSRFGRADVRVGHYRRYDPDHLKKLLVSSGFTEPVIRVYGFLIGDLLDWGRNLMARRSVSLNTAQERTAGSARWLQPPEWLGWATAAATAPFRLIQRPLVNTGLGTGFVVLSRRLG